MQYEEYLDRQVSATDMYYLQDIDLARQLVELGYRGSGETISREEFEERKAHAEVTKQESSRNQPQKLASAGKDLEECSLLSALARREKAIRNGKHATVVFLRDRNSKGQEISGYIDVAHRFENDEIEAIFDGSARFLPKPTDLSYYNWHTQKSLSNSTPHFQVISDNEKGLQFKNKRDNEVIYVDPHARSPGNNSFRLELDTDEYLQAVIFDHILYRQT
jgi:hypothetical protein